ncbi:Rad1/Rec1/Rad17 [Lipomyces arxii]|uniref:Rad1/Rec1/Rad17 n=1 Tax=Lipomyces arxii TaxID=56418 RepID=UPI0034CD9CBB
MIANASSQSSDASELSPSLDAVTTCVTYFYRVLQSVALVSKRAKIQISSEGITVSVENSRVVQAHLQLSKPLFTSYIFTPPQPSTLRPTGFGSPVENVTPECYTFGISLARLVECFQIFGNDAQDSVIQRQRPKAQSGSVYDTASTAKSFVGGTCVGKLRYDEPGSPLVLMFDDSGVTTTCEFLTAVDDYEVSDIALQADSICTKVIMKATYLTDVFRELDSAGSDTLTVRSTATPPTLTFICRGDAGSVEYAFSRDRNTVETFASNEFVQNVYNFKMVVGMAKDAVKLATKVSLRIDVNGVMSIQCMCDVGDGRQSFIDFRSMPVYDEYDLPSRQTQPGRGVDYSDSSSDDEY